MEERRDECHRKRRPREEIAEGGRYRNLSSTLKEMIKEKQSRNFQGERKKARAAQQGQHWKTSKEKRRRNGEMPFIMISVKKGTEVRDKIEAGKVGKEEGKKVGETNWTATA